MLRRRCQCAYGSQRVDGREDGEPGNGVDVVAAAAAVTMLVVMLKLEKRGGAGGMCERR